MVEVLSNQVLQAISKLIGKGNPAILTGPTGCGKSTSLGSLTEDEVVQKILQIREAEGKGSTAVTNIMVTNHPDIPEEGVIMKAKITAVGMPDVNDDGDLLGELLYTASTDYKKNPSNEIFNSKLEKVFEHCLQNPSNDSLAYKLRYVDRTDCDDLLAYIKTVDISSVMAVYEEMIARTPKKGQGQKIFIDILRNNSELNGYLEGYWQKVIDCINKDAEKLVETLQDAGAKVITDDEGNCIFDIFFGKDDIGTELLNMLLKSEDKSKEYFMSDIYLIYRGKDNIFSGKNSQYLKVAEENDKSIYCLHLVDTQGLFHSAGVKPREEYERIIDMLASHHSNTLVLVINSNVDNTVKNSYETIRLLLAEATRNIDIFILYTWWDDYMRRSSQNINNSHGRFGFKSRTVIDWEEVYQKAMLEQEKLTESFRKVIKLNSSKHKPVIRGTFCAAFLTDQSSEMEQKLYEKGVFYPVAMKCLVDSILLQEVANGPKYRVTEADNCCTLDVTGVNQTIKALYRDMVVNCKGLRLYAATVRACVRKWVYVGTEHKSDIAENSYGFRNIRTAFVQDIRNLGAILMNRIVIDSCCVLDNNMKEQFEQAMENYLKENFGREIAMSIGSDSYKKGFTGAYGLYQYEYFSNMIAYTQNHYFRGEQIVFGDKSKELTERINYALAKCVRSFIDSRCIEVY